MIYSPGTAIADDLDASTAPTAPVTNPETPAVKPATPPEPSPQAKELLAVINADREARELAAKHAAEAQGYKAKYEEAQAKLSEYDKAKGNALLDSAGYMRKQGYSDKEIATFAENLMYALVPDRAPPDHRAKVVEAQMLRDRKEAEEREARRPAEEAARLAKEQAEYGQKIEAQYTAQLKQAVPGFQPGAYAASQAWFGTDHDKYAESLFTTAREMAEAAQRAGTRSDLTPQNVAKELEARMLERFARFQAASQAQPKQAAAPTPPARSPAPVKEPPPVQPDGIIARDKKARYNEADLVRRAVAAGFKN